MKEKIKNIIRRKTLVIPVFLAIVIALIIYGIGVQKNSSVSRDDYATENNEQILSDLGKSDIALETADEDETENAEHEPEQVLVHEASNSELNDQSVSDSSNNDVVENNGEETSPVSSKPQVEKITSPQGEEEPVYSITISANTIDGKPYTKTFSSSNPNDTFKYYKDVREGNKINRYEITMTFTGKEVSRRLVGEGEEIVATDPAPEDTIIESM